MSRILCRTASSSKRRDSLSGPWGLNTTAFSRLPPLASPRDRMNSISRSMQKVRAVARSRTYFSGLRVNSRLWRPMAGWSKSMP